MTNYHFWMQYSFCMLTILKCGIEMECLWGANKEWRRHIHYSISCFVWTCCQSVILSSWLLNLNDLSYSLHFYAWRLSCIRKLLIHVIAFRSSKKLNCVCVFFVSFYLVLRLWMWTTPFQNHQLTRISMNILMSFCQLLEYSGAATNYSGAA